MLKSGITFVVGLLTIAIGIIMLREGYNTSKFYDTMNSLKPAKQDIKNWEKAGNLYDVKSNALVIYGVLAVAYGVIVAGLALVDKDHDANKVIGAIVSVGVLIVIVALVMKNSHPPKGIKNH